MNGLLPAEVSRVAMRLPPIWAKRPAAWFTQVEAKFRHIISQLDHRYATEVEDIVNPPPQQDPNTRLRTELLNLLSLSREKRVCQLLTLDAMGDRKLSQFLRDLRSLAPDRAGSQ
jgi:hypothetical protein